MSKILVDTIDTRSGTTTLTLGSTNAGTIALGSGDVQSNFLQPNFHVYLNSNQTLSNSTQTVVQFATELWDSDSKYDTSTYKFTPTIAGKYFLYSQLRFNTTTNFDSIQCSIFQNTTEVGRGQMINDNNNTCCVSAFVDSDTDDYFQVKAFQNSGGDAAVGGFQAISYFLGFRIGT